MNALKFKEMICSRTRVERCDIFYKLMSYVRDRIPYDHDARELYEFIVELCHLNDTVDDKEFKDGVIWSMVGNYVKGDTFKVIVDNSLWVD
jgi:hypothetical protein